VLNKMLGLRIDPGLPNARPDPREEGAGLGMLAQGMFRKLLCFERRRAERSGRHFVLMLLHPGNLLATANARAVPKLVSIISASTRDTDIMGWYKDDSVIGVIFTEVSADDKSSVQTLSGKLTDALHSGLTVPEISEIKVTFHVFPEDWDEDPEDPITATLQMALATEVNRKPISRLVKRLMDMGGSVLGLLLCLPLFVIIAISIKLTSRGPVLFKQVRLGQYGRKFTFLKFRSMYVNSDYRIHEEYVTQFIMGSAGAAQTAGTEQKVYKLTADPRITPVGRFLRNSSLDELPQFLNVLLGEMSLVGPRPPLVYEFERYDLWHRQRLLAAKPGITGLWQVDGRSRVKFDEMVRLDIRYARSWSLWLDLRILLQTPRAVLSRNGAC